MEEVGLSAPSAGPRRRAGHGQQQWLEIGMLLMQDPELLLVDEPVAGMTDAARPSTPPPCWSASPAHRSVVVVEHDMEFVRALAQQGHGAARGPMLSEGSIDQVQSDPRVIEVYLGR